MKNDAEVRLEPAPRAKSERTPRSSRTRGSRAKAKQPSPRRGPQSPSPLNRLFKGWEWRHAEATSLLGEMEASGPGKRALGRASPGRPTGKGSHGTTNHSEGHLRAPRAAGKGSIGVTNHGEGHLRAPPTAGKGSTGSNEPSECSSVPDLRVRDNRTGSRQAPNESPRRHATEPTDRRPRASDQATDHDAPGPSGPDNSRPPAQRLPSGSQRVGRQKPAPRGQPELGRT